MQVGDKAIYKPYVWDKRSEAWRDADELGRNAISYPCEIIEVKDTLFFNYKVRITNIQANKDVTFWADGNELIRSEDEF